MAMNKRELCGFETVSQKKDLVVVGGGLAGVCAAVAAARSGLKVALVHDRCMLGGNSSSECRVWICGATGMGFNRYADETGIIGEISQENLLRNPDGNPYAWDALLLETVLNEQNIELMLETRMLSVEREGASVKSVCCAQFSSETAYTLSAPLFIDATGDGLLARMAGNECVMGNADISQMSRERFGLGGDSASLGSTILFYVKKLEHPVKYTAPAFALPLNDIERALSETGKHIKAGDNGCDYWWLEYGGSLNIIKDNERIRFTLLSLVYGVWNYIKNSGKFDADALDLEWVGSFPARRESYRALARYTLSESDILENREFSDAVCHGGWPIDTHPSSGFFDARESCSQLPVDPYGIPLGCLIAKDIENVLLAGRDAGMTHLAMASARVMKTCAVEGQAAGAAAALAVSENTLPRDFSKEQIEALKNSLSRDDVWIPGHRLDARADLARGMSITASEPLAPDAGAPIEYAPLRASAFIVLTPLRKKARVSVHLKALKPERAELKLYESIDPASYKPKALIYSNVMLLNAGENIIEIEIPTATRGNALIEVKANDNISIGVAKSELPGMLGVFSEGALGLDLFAPAARVTGMDDMFDCVNCIDGYTRPYGGMHMWASPLEGAYLELRAEAPARVGEIRIYLDNALYRAHNNLRPQKNHFAEGYIHPGLLKSFKVYTDGPDGPREYNIADNHMRMVIIKTNGARVTRLRVTPLTTWGASYAAIHEIALFE